MAIIFPSNTIAASGSNNINVPGGIIQFVDNQQTISTTATTSAWINVLSTSITITNPSNKILIDYFMNDRSDQGNGTWSLIYHRILRNDGTQVMYSGYNGACANFIGYYARSFFDAPGAGTWTYTASVLAYQGTVWIGSYNSGSTNHYLRLWEIGT
jgi:hypothetical protein